jgi:hypothetical protein
MHDGMNILVAYDAQPMLITHLWRLLLLPRSSIHMSMFFTVLGMRESAKSLKGGTDEWSKKGYPTTKD